MANEDPWDLPGHSNRLGVGNLGNRGVSGATGDGAHDWQQPRPLPSMLPQSGVPPSIPATSRKPGGRRRAGQRAPGRCPPNPHTPVDPRVVLSVLERTWTTPSGRPNPWRTRSLAALAVALVVPLGTTSIELCRMLPADLVRLRLPNAGRRWLKKWLDFRAYFVGGIEADLTPWTAAPPCSNGRPRQVGWGVLQTLHRAGAPAWRMRELLATSRQGPPARECA